jgi:hypothetical protein
MEKRLNFMESKSKTIILILVIFCAITTNANASAIKRNIRTSINNRNIERSTMKKEIDVKKLFDSYYSEWQSCMKKPEVMFSSRSEDYINCESYKNIEKLGINVLPYVIKKMEDGKNNSWKNGEYLLWHAVQRISGVNLPYDSSEQKMADKYIQWYKNKEGGVR